MPTPVPAHVSGPPSSRPVPTTLPPPPTAPSFGAPPATNTPTIRPNPTPIPPSVITAGALRARTPMFPDVTDRAGRGLTSPPGSSGREPESSRIAPPPSSREPSLLDSSDDLSRYGPLSSALRRKKILIVDDSFTAIMMCRAILSKRAYDIVTARDGREAIDKALQERPDLILMDVVMPHMDGFQACMRLRAMDTTKHVPIFLLTTKGEAESVTQGFASGCNAYISKPLNGPELLAKIKSYLGE